MRLRGAAAVVAALLLAVAACTSGAAGAASSDGPARASAPAASPPLPSGPASPAPAPPAALPRIALPPPGRLYHGVFPGGRSGNEDDITEADVDAYESAVGHRVAWVYFSHNWYLSPVFPRRTARWIQARGSVPFIRLMLRSSPKQSVAEPRFTVAAIAQGAFDEELRAWGRAARDHGGPLLAEWGTEMNGRWFSWNGVWNGGAGEGPRRFRAAYRRIVDTVRSAGAANVTWVFHVNAEDDPDAAWNRFEHYYPGDDVVDWLAVSVYGAQTPMERSVSSFAAKLEPVLPRFAALAPTRPVVVAEMGTAARNPVADPARWTDGALEGLVTGRWPAVRGFAWWNETWENDDDKRHDTDMRVQAVPGVAAVFRRRLRADGLAGRPGIRGSPLPARSE